MKKIVLASLLAAFAAPAVAQAPLPNVSPAIWAVKDADTTIYLFGTVHALDGKQDWFNDEVKTAYDASQELVFEAIMPEPQAAMAKVTALGQDPTGRTLPGRLKPETAKLLVSELTKLGVPGTALDRFEPWFAAMMIANLTMRKLGMSPESGVEELLRTAARKDGKPVGEVESFDWQMNLFDSLPEDLQVAMLSDSLESMDEAEKVMGQMVSTWSRGDIDGLSKIMNESMVETPALGKILLADRNARWAEWIEQRLQKPGTVFMAVGAGHLGGAESVQAMLGKRGIESVRLNK